MTILVRLHSLHLLYVVGIGEVEMRIRGKDRCSIPAGRYIQESGPNLLAVILAVAAVVRIVSA